MATIKRNGNLVVLKGGKVSCSCCDTECCMYPAQALADGLYTADDLPDAVTIAGVSYSRSGTQYGNTENGVIFEEDVWAKYTSGVRSSRACLIQGGVEDQFADTYTVTYDSDITCLSVSSTVTRESLCVWKGIADDGTTITLEIEFGSFSDLYAWTTNAPNCGGNRRGIGMPFDRDNNIGRLNTPLGNYEDEIAPDSVIHIVS